PAAVVDGELAALAPHLAPGDAPIDGGNSHYHHDIPPAPGPKARKLHYVGVGPSGGGWGARAGHCVLIGGEDGRGRRTDPIFATLAPGVAAALRTPGRERSNGTAEQGYLHCGPSGAGHFVKMVHNGIEYGLMAAYAEGLNILRHADAGMQSRTVDAETTP